MRKIKRIKILNFIIIFLNFSYCLAQEINKDFKNSFFLNPRIEINASNSANYKELVDCLKEFLQTKNSDYSSNRYWLKNDNKYYTYPFFEIYNIEKNEYDKNNIFRPILLSLTKIETDQTIVKLAWISTEDISLKIIYNFIAIKTPDGFKFKNILDYNSCKWKKETIGDISYIYYPNYQFSRKNAIKFNKLNKKFSTYFGTDIIKFKYFIGKSFKQLMEIRGYDFEASMFFENQNGAETFPHDNLIFSGNNNEINIHELVHLYVFWNFRDIHPIIKEGISTFLGGSKGLGYKEHILKLKEHIKKNDINIYEELFHSNYVLDESTSLRYTIGALICDIVLKECGKKGLFKLMNSGKSDDELLQVIQELLNIDKVDFNTFIKKKLETYE